MASALPDVTGVTSPSTDDASSEQNDETKSEEDNKKPELVWEQEDVTLDYIGDEDRLPCVCQFENVQGEGTAQLSQGLRVYSKQPVLMYTRTTKLQAHVRSIHKDSTGAYYEIGQTLIIPYDYPGWFEVVPSDFSRATCYTSIDGVAKAMPAKFFTRSNLKGIRIEGEGEQQKYLERKISAGSVLQTNGTFKAKWKTRAETGLFKKKTKEWDTEEVTYLKCIDQNDTEILVPVSHKGKFNAIYEKGKLNPNSVYSMRDVLKDLSLPTMVRLLYGKAPVVPCIFTGMLIIRETAIDDVIIGSTVVNKRNVLFEIPVDSPVTVKYMSTDEQFADSATYKDAQKLCRKYSRLYSTMIKLSPELDTGQKVIQHVPSDPSVMPKSDETLRVLDLITDISLTSEPKDHLLDTSDSGSQSSQDQQSVMPAGARLMDQGEYDFKSREFHSHV